MIKTLKKPTFLWLVIIIIITFWIYLPTLSYFPEGDDFLFLWHIRVPVGLINVPFYDWDQPLAGRYGYGQAWYGATLNNLFGFQYTVFNLFGVLVKILSLICLYFFTVKLTKSRGIALLSVLIFSLSSTGLNGEISFFLHFVFIFMSIFLIAIALFLEGSVDNNIKKVVIGSLLLLSDSYLYTIRAVGITLLPLFTILRLKLFKESKSRIFYITFSLIVVLTSTILVTKFIPGADSYAASTLVESSKSIIKSVQQGHYEYIRALLVSISSMLIPINFFSLINKLLNAGTFPYKYLESWSLVIWILLYIAFVYPFYIFKKISKKFLLLTIPIGIIWSLLLLFLTKHSISVYIGGEVVSLTLGFQLFFIGTLLGFIYLKEKKPVGATMLSAIAAALVFYLPNWLHDPIILSVTESRYFTVSSAFTSIFLAISIYTLFSHSLNFGKIKELYPSIIYMIFTIIFTLIILISHIQNFSQIIYKTKDMRRADIVETHWNFVKSKVDFRKKPLIVVIWAEDDLYNAKREFFKDETFGLIGNLPYDFNSNNDVKLFYNYQDSMNIICDWGKNGVNFDYNNFYEFHLSADRKIYDYSKLGRENLRTWENYCQDNSQKGTEVGVNPKAR